MCECGCNELVPLHIFQVGEYVMVVELYKGCGDCDTGIMFTINLFTEADAKELDFVPEDELFPDEFGYCQRNFPILERRDLIDAFNKMVSAGDLFTDDMQEALDDRGSGHTLLRNAVNIRQDFEKGTK